MVKKWPINEAPLRESFLLLSPPSNRRRDRSGEGHGGGSSGRLAQLSSGQGGGRDTALKPNLPRTRSRQSGGGEGATGRRSLNFFFNLSELCVKIGTMRAKSQASFLSCADVF